MSLSVIFLIIGSALVFLSAVLSALGM